MFLIVAPLSVLYNWKDELDTWGYFRVTILHGNKKDNELIRIKQRKCEIALTTYETLRLCLDELNSLEWSAVIVDEAHRIRNPKARVTEVMKSLKCNVRIGLTGTILQNNMKELWCIMDWAVPGLLGSKIYFKKQFSDPVEHGQRHTATKRELATGRKAMQRLAKKMSGWFLRRTKTLIKDQLPKKEDRTNSHGETVKTLYFSYLSVLQKVANHIALLQASGASKQQLLDVLQQYCMASGLDYRRLDGSTKSEDRLKIVKEFNSTQDINICLVSTMAGGLGLNFVGANVVVLFDPTWNPANDLQAIDRAYRIGQCRDVKVLRLISLGTVEEIMYLRQVYKQQLHCVVVGSENAKRYFEAVQGSKEHRGELFGIYNLFKLRTQGSCLTRDILEPGEPDCQERRGSEQPAEPLAKEACDLFSDFSDDESLNKDSGIKTARSKASEPSKASGPPGQLTLLQCGFSKLLESQHRAAEDWDGASGDESSDEQPTCLSTVAEDVRCQKNQDFHGSSKLKLDNVLNPNEDGIFYQNEEILEQNISSESGDEKKFKNTAEHHGTVQNVSDSEDSDVIFPTQYTAQRFPKRTARLEPSLKGSEDSVRGNSVKIRNKGDGEETAERGNKRISTKLNPEGKILKPVMKRKSTSDISDESDDIEMSSNARRRRATSSLRFKRKKESKREFCNFSETMRKKKQLHATDEDHNSQLIDDFSSSDDDLSANQQRKGKIHFSSKMLYHHKNSPAVPRKQVKFSNEKVVDQEQMYESMDKLLDGVQEVAYVHSNQNVIGSSKAENHMSRWAARDVFELKQFSQLPANIAVCSSKTYEEKVNPDIPTHTKEGQQPSEGGISSPLYISHPVSQKKKKVYHTGQTTFIIGKTPKGIRSEESLSGCGKTKKLPTSSSREIGSGENDQAPSDTVAFQSLNSKSEVYERNLEDTLEDHWALTRTGVSTNAPFSKLDNKKTKNPALENSSIEGLLGDTSILDDLFQSHRKSPTQLPKKVLPGPSEKAKQRPKDFWDILNEQNDDSLSKLTDLAVIETLCDRAPLAASSKKKEELETSLWKSNEKFLWKKFDSGDTDENTTATE
ncbi:Putative DNA repair and recombination protein RAD26-like protein [Tupaia chinensis]|uniref:Putative DNA repair and recombination protein RAD26-like protein n=1 Tax=Tupaia chinensis TaxID=246437 RepID=L8Y7V1_TUPCH|nr:Putative DNA repair and recombination protein RAD26-like protein [Tupaia chinensis]